MLAKVAPPTRDFFALARYLVHGKVGHVPPPDRVAWVVAHNLPSDDPELAAKLMTATAALSPRTRRAAYHLMVSWAPDERPTAELMQTIALETLDRAGLGTHQALVMGHGDTAHSHLHMMINRVNPETGVAWRTSHDYARFDAIMWALADAYGFRAVPAHLFAPDETDEQPKQPNTRATYAGKRGASTTRPQWSRADARNLGGRLSENLDASSTWDDLVEAVSDEGYRLEAKGRGFVVGDDAGYAKLSSLQLLHTARDMRARKRTIDRPRSMPTTRPSVLSVDEIDITRAMVTLGFANRDAVREAVAAAEEARLVRMECAPLMAQLLYRLGRVNTSLSQPLQRANRSTTARICRAAPQRGRSRRPKGRA